MDSIRTICTTGFDAVQEDNFVFPFSHCNLQIADGGLVICERCEFVIMRRKECPRAPLREPFSDRPRKTESIKCACASPDFIEHHQTLRCGVMKDVRSLRHLDHKCRTPCVQFIARADACEDSVAESDDSALRRNETSRECHQCDECILANECRLSSHVGTSHKCERGCCIRIRTRAHTSKRAIIWNELSSKRAIENRMSCLFDIKNGLIDNLRSHITVAYCAFGE